MPLNLVQLVELFVHIPLTETDMAKVSIRDRVYSDLLTRYPDRNLSEAVSSALAELQTLERLLRELQFVPVNSCDRSQNLS